MTWITVTEAMTRFRRTRPNLLAEIRCYRDMHGLESVGIRKQGGLISEFTLSDGLVSVLRRKKI